MPKPTNRLRDVLFVGLTVMVACGAGLVAHAQIPKTAQFTVKRITVPIPLLWKVSDQDNAVYLLGSFHLLKPNDYPLAAEVNSAFEDAESIIFELPPEEMASPALGIQMAQAALRTDGTVLNDELTPAVIKKLDLWTAANADALQRSGLRSEMLQRFEPWFVALTITLTNMHQQGLDSKLGLDAHFSAQAKRAHKPTSGFETGLQQVAFLDGMDKKEQLQFIDEALTQSNEGKQEIDKLHTAWRNGDAAVLWQEMAAEMKVEYPALYRRINVERNDAWLPKIEQRLKQNKDDTLVVVGTLHLLGEDGVVEKLRAKGYRVTRICAACNANASK